MPISVESVSPEGALIVVSHVFTFAIDAFEGMRTGHALGSFESGGGLIWGWLCSTMLALCDVRVCVGHYTFGIETRELYMKRLSGSISNNCGTGGRWGSCW